MNKILIAVIVAAAVAVCGAIGYFGYKYVKAKDTIAEQALQIAQLTDQIGSLQAVKVAQQVQNTLKDSEKEQTDSLLEECYRALARQAEDLSTIENILTLPKEYSYENQISTNSTKPDSAAIDFLNQQLLDVK